MKKVDLEERKRIELPAYTIADAARYVHVPLATIRSWIQGRSYPTGRGTKHSAPIIVPPSRGHLEARLRHEYGRHRAANIQTAEAR